MSATPKPPTYLAQQAALDVGTATAWVGDEATRVRRRWPGQHLWLRPRRGTSRRPRAGGGRGRGGRAREGARGQEAGGGLHAGGTAQRRPELVLGSARPRLRVALPGFSTLRARPREPGVFINERLPPPGCLVIASSAPFLAGRFGEALPSARSRHLKNPPPCPDVLQGHSSRSGLKGAEAALVSPTGARLLIFFISATPSTW